jgi:hypothetical protein
MNLTEAIKQAKKLSKQNKPLLVIFDKELNDYFISEAQNFPIPDNFYETSPYEIIEIFH